MKSIPSYLLHKRLFVLYFLLSFTALIPTNLFADDWTPVTPPNSPDARHGHSMVTLPDGRVMMFGGENVEGDLFNDMHAFEEEGWNRVTPTNAPPPARKNHQAWVYDDNMYVYGGYRDSDMLDDTWKYDLGANSWVEVQPPRWRRKTISQVRPPLPMEAP